MIDLYDDDRQREFVHMMSVVNCLTYVYVIGMCGLLYFCIFPNTINM